MIFKFIFLLWYMLMACLGTVLGLVKIKNKTGRQYLWLFKVLTQHRKILTKTAGGGRHV